MSRGARALVRRAPSLASPPVAYERLVEVIDHPRSGLADIAHVISEDQGLTARLLRVVNSAFFSFPRRVESVTQAVSVVGTSQIRDLALATSVMSLFDDVPDDLVDMESFWHHSLACGVTARVLAGHRREPNVERFLVAGLLHDVGRLLLYMEAGGEAAEALELARRTGVPLVQAERDVIGFDHADVGHELLREWRFPATFQEAVRLHHRPAMAGRYPVEVAVVHVADLIAHAMGWGRSGETRVPPFHAPAWAGLGLDASRLPEVVGDVERQLQGAVHLLAA